MIILIDPVVNSKIQLELNFGSPELVVFVRKFKKSEKYYSLKDLLKSVNKLIQEVLCGLLGTSRVKFLLTFM